MTGLGLTRVKGRAGKQFPIVATRELTQEDVALAETVEKGSSPPPLKRISERHHALARLLAEGATATQAAVQLGFHPSTVSILRDDPAFKELVQFYRDSVDQQYMDHHEQLAGLSLDAIIVLRERLEESPDALEVPQLVKMAEMALDRTGFGPSTKQEVNVHVGLADRLDAARKRVQEFRRSRNPSDEIIDVEAAE